MKDKKYCIFCGTENDIHNEKCCNKKCKKKFVEDYYDLLYLVVDYYKGDFDGKFFDLLKAILSYLLSTWTYGAVVVFSIIAATTSVISAINNDPEDIPNVTDSTPRSFLTVDKVNVSNEVTDSLLSYATSLNEYNVDYDYSYTEMFNDKVIVSELDSRTKLSMAFGVASKNRSDAFTADIYQDCSRFSGFNEGYSYCDKEVSSKKALFNEQHIGIDGAIISVSNISKNDIVDAYKKMFDDDIKFESFMSGSKNYCEWNGNDYLCYSKGDINNDSIRKTNIIPIDTRTYANMIEIDVAYSVCENGKCYTNDDKKIEVADVCRFGECVGFKYPSDLRGLKYTLVYLKNSSGDYEWYSVENTHEYYYER